MNSHSNSASYRAYQIIKSKIMRNEFDPRRRLNEIDLAKELQLSRTPIREALIMLEKDELITKYEDTRGFYLKQYSLQDVHDLYEFRSIIELSLAKSLIDKISEPDLDTLESILSEVNGLIEGEHPAEALVRALDFHLFCIRVASSNFFLINSLRSCYDKFIVISWTCHDINACQNSHREHEMILAALRSRNLDNLRERIQMHIASARDRITQLIKLNDDKLYYMP